MQKHFHNLVLGVSVLPALLVLPAVAENFNQAINVVDETKTDVDWVITGVENDEANFNITPRSNDSGQGVTLVFVDGESVFDGDVTKIDVQYGDDGYPTNASNGKAVGVYVNKTADVNFSAKDTDFSFSGTKTGSNPWGKAFEVAGGGKATFNGSGDVTIDGTWLGYSSQPVTTRTGAVLTFANDGNLTINAKSDYGTNAVCNNATINVDIDGDFIINSGAFDSEGNFDSSKLLPANAIAIQTYSDMSIKANNVSLNTFGAAKDYSIGTDGTMVFEIGNEATVSVDASKLKINSVSTVAESELAVNHEKNYGIFFEGAGTFKTTENTDTVISSFNENYQAYGVYNQENQNGKAIFDGALTIDATGASVAKGILLTKDGEFTSNNNLNINSHATKENGLAIGLDIADGATASLNGKTSFLTNGSSADTIDIANAGVLNIGGTTTVDKGIVGTGDLTIADGATLNIGTASISQGTVDLKGTLIATVRDGTSQINVGEFTDESTGSVKLALDKAGTYHVFGNSVFDNVDVSSSVFDLNWAQEGKDLVASVKTAEKIAESTGVAAESAKAISNIAKAETEPLQELSVKLQEKLAEADTNPEAMAVVEHATKAVHPETESVAQSVSTSVQNTVVNLASARMAMPVVGRNGGDVELTSGGVWVQGLFNKSKQNDAFNGYTRGIAAGLDGIINKHWTIGAGYSFAHSDINGTARDTEIDSNTIFVYGQYKPSEWYVNGIVNYTMSDYSERGTVIDNAVVTGNYDVNSFGGSVNTGYDFASGITPELGLRYMHISADDYANSYGIKTHMDDSDFLTGIAGVKYAFDITATKHLTFSPKMNAGIKYDLLSDNQVATVAMPGLDAYTLDGQRLKRIGGEFGIGLGMNYRDLEVSVNYDIDVREDYTSQTGMLKFRYNF